MSETRSPAFDLLFDDSKVDRVHGIAPYLEMVDDVSEEIALHRVTVFLTYGCNLACPYCKTIVRDKSELETAPQKASVFSYNDLVAMLAGMKASEIDHLHFTGGEPALARDLPKMIQHAKTRRVRYCSMTSNGTLPMEVYRSLVDGGMDEIRISLDASEPATGLLMSGGRENAWHRAVETIRGLAAMRDCGMKLFLLANAVISDANRSDMAKIVRFILGLGVGDLRLLCVASQKATLWDFPDSSRTLSEIHNLLSEYDDERFPLLRKKVASVFAPDETGLENASHPHGKKWRCYIPLTERTYDGTAYYPCSNYLREGGSPIGRLSDSWSEQHDKTVKFTKEFSPLDDMICRQYCSHCTKSFNMHANAAREAN